MGMGWKRQLSD